MRPRKGGWRGAPSGMRVPVHCSGKTRAPVAGLVVIGSRYKWSVSPTHASQRRSGDSLASFIAIGNPRIVATCARLGTSQTGRSQAKASHKGYDSDLG